MPCHSICTVFHLMLMLFSCNNVNTNYAFSQAYVWRFDPVHPKTFVLGVLVGKCQFIWHSRVVAVAFLVSWSDIQSIGWSVCLSVCLSVCDVCLFVPPFTVCRFVNQMGDLSVRQSFRRLIHPSVSIRQSVMPVRQSVNHFIRQSITQPVVDQPIN